MFSFAVVVHTLDLFLPPLVRAHFVTRCNAVLSSVHSAEGEMRCVWKEAVDLPAKLNKAQLLSKTENGDYSQLIPYIYYCPSVLDIVLHQLRMHCYAVPQHPVVTR